jgi:hypothetical protein
MMRGSWRAAAALAVVAQQKSLTRPSTGGCCLTQHMVLPAA